MKITAKFWWYLYKPHCRWGRQWQWCLARYWELCLAVSCSRQQVTSKLLALNIPCHSDPWHVTRDTAARRALTFGAILHCSAAEQWTSTKWTIHRSRKNNCAQFWVTTTSPKLHQSEMLFGHLYFPNRHFEHSEILRVGFRCVVNVLWAIYLGGWRYQWGLVWAGADSDSDIGGGGHPGRGWSLHRAAHSGADTQLETERSSAALGSCCSVLGASQHARIPRVITHGCAGPGLVTAAVPTRAVNETSRNFTLPENHWRHLLQILGVARMFTLQF